MKLEEAILFLRDGLRIYRESDPDKGSLCGDTKKVLGSFYLTIYDILAEDWHFCFADQDPSEPEKEEEDEN